MEWPTAEIDQTVRPTDAQRASLVALQNATTKAADLLKASCLTDDPLTPPARLAAVGKQLDTMLQAVKMVSSALNDFYGTLSDEQKAQFEAIGPQRTTQLESLEVARSVGIGRPGQAPYLPPRRWSWLLGAHMSRVFNDVQRMRTTDLSRGRMVASIASHMAAAGMCVAIIAALWLSTRFKPLTPAKPRMWFAAGSVAAGITPRLISSIDERS